MLVSCWNWIHLQGRFIWIRNPWRVIWDNDGLCPSGVDSHHAETDIVYWRGHLAGWVCSWFLEFGLECLPHEGQSSSSSKTHSHTHTQAKVNPWEHLLVVEDTLLLLVFVSVRVLFSVLLLPSSSHPLFMTGGLWAAVPAPSTICQHWPVNCSLLSALTSLGVQLSCWTVSDSCLKRKSAMLIFSSLEPSYSSNMWINSLQHVFQTYDKQKNMWDWLQSPVQTLCLVMPVTNRISRPSQRNFDCPVSLHRSRRSPCTCCTRGAVS